MSIRKWIRKNTESLAGKTVAISGATGGIGRRLCEYLAGLGADLILLDRNEQKSAALRVELARKYPSLRAETLPVDMQDMESVKRACAELEKRPLDILIHNAGAYKIPRCITREGYDNAFQINFLSPYYMTVRLLPHLREREREGSRVIAVGSIAHTYSSLDETDIDFRGRTAASRVYGNAKRFLMCSLWELFRDEERVKLAIAHPGITSTGITSHYPKAVYAIIKYPMKVIFMRPKKACLSILRGVFQDCGHSEWIGPRVFRIWGYPHKTRLRTVPEAECKRIGEIADSVLKSL